MSDIELKLINKLAKLSEDHRMLQQTLTEAIQPHMRDLLKKEREADQIIQAVKKGSVKSPSYIPTVEHGYWSTLRRIVAEAVYSIYNEHQRQTKDRREIIPIVQDRIELMRKTGQWPHDWKTPGRDTLIRRLNETADIKHYPGGVTATICISPGHYIPNPARFEDPTASTLKEFAEKWKKHK